MAGVKLGDRVLFAGTDDIGLATLLATQAGLSGRVVILAPDRARADARAAAVERAGALVEPHVAALDAAHEPGAFDVIVADGTLAALDDNTRGRALRALFIALRAGGRLVWIEPQPKSGLFGLGASAPSHEPARERELTAAGFRGVRTLAAAGGRIFVEGIRSASEDT